MPRTARTIEAFELEDRLLLSASPLSPEMLAALAGGAEGAVSDAGQASPQATQVDPGDFVFSSADNPAAPASSATGNSGSSLSSPGQAPADVESAAAADAQFSLVFDAGTGRLTIQGDSGDNVVRES